MYEINNKPFSVMQGLTLASIYGLVEGSERVEFRTTCGRTFRMFYDPD